MGSVQEPSAGIDILQSRMQELAARASGHWRFWRKRGQLRTPTPGVCCHVLQSLAAPLHALLPRTFPLPYSGAYCALNVCRLLEGFDRTEDSVLRTGSRWKVQNLILHAAHQDLCLRLCLCLCLSFLSFFRCFFPTPSFSALGSKPAARRNASACSSCRHAQVVSACACVKCLQGMMNFTEITLPVKMRLFTGVGPL